MKEIADRALGMERLKDQWQISTEVLEDGEIGYWQTWSELWAPHYRQMADRFLVYTHVCEFIWDANPECQHQDTWEDKYDGRGAEFRKEYVEEIRKIIDENAVQIRAQRLKKAEL